MGVPPRDHADRSCAVPSSPDRHARPRRAGVAERSRRHLQRARPTHLGGEDRSHPWLTSDLKRSQQSRRRGPMPSADEIRAAQRATWARLSAGWDKWDSVIMDQLRPVGAAMIERLGITEGQQHLDIASGTGEPGLSIAQLAPKGRVVLTDLA